MRLGVTLDILNQKGTPAFFADTFANRPAAGFTGRIFVSTDTFDLYRDTGTAWVLLSPSSSGTITGTGTTNTIPLWTGASAIGNSALTQNTGVSISIGSVGTPYDFIGYGNNYAAKFIKNGASATDILAGDGTSITAGTNITISAGQISATFSGGVTGTGSAGQVSFWSGASSISGNNNLFWDNVNGHLGIGTITPGTALGITHNQNTIVQLNQSVLGNDNRIAFLSNGVTNWRIGNFYNVGANDFAFYDVLNSAERFSIKTTGQTFVGTQTTSSGLFVVNNSTADQHLVVLGANAPSMRVRNAGFAANYQFGIGLATTSNNFIQGTTLGEMCIFNDSLFDSPILFGIRTSISGLTNEVGRFASDGNFTITNGRIILNGNSSDLASVMIMGSATYPTGKIVAPNAGGTLLIAGQSGTGMTIDTTGAASFVSNVSSSGTFIGRTTNGQAFGCGNGIDSDLGIYVQSNNILFTNTGTITAISFAIGGVTKFAVKPNTINVGSIPTSSAGLVTGDIYSNAGILTIV